jgi:hypothetical protein
MFFGPKEGEMILKIPELFAGRCLQKEAPQAQPVQSSSSVVLALHPISCQE